MTFNFKKIKPSAAFGGGVTLIDEFWCIDKLKSTRPYKTSNL